MEYPHGSNRKSSITMFGMILSMPDFCNLENGMLKAVQRILTMLAHSTKNYNHTH